MGNNSELLIKISDRSKEVKSSNEKLRSSFEKQWVNSGPISTFPIDLYPQAQHKKLQPKLHKDFDKFFSKKSEIAQEKRRKNDNAVVFYLTHNLKTSTYKKLYGYNSDWEKSKVVFFVCNGKSYFQYCLASQKLLLIFRESRNGFTYCWAVVSDSCEEIKTDDGKYFIAYKIMGKVKQITIKQQEELLDNFDINLRAVKNQFYSKVLRKNQVKEMGKLLQ